MRASLARHIGAMVAKSAQTALQADNRLPESLSVVGETRIPDSTWHISYFGSSRCRNLDVYILTGMLVHHRGTPRIKFTGTHLYTLAERASLIV